MRTARTRASAPTPGGIRRQQRPGGARGELPRTFATRETRACFPLGRRPTQQSVAWSGTLDPAAPGAGWADQWNIVSTATVSNPTGPGSAPVTRTGEGGRSGDQAHGDADRAEQPSQLHLRECDQLPPERDRRLTGLYGQRSPPAELHDNQRVDRERSRQSDKVAVGETSTRNRTRTRRDTSTAPPARRTTSVRCMSTAYARRRPTTRRSTRAFGEPPTRSGPRRTAPIPPDFLDFVPKLTCCSRHLHPPSRRRDVAQQHGRGVSTADLADPLNPCTTGSLPTSVFPRELDTASGADLDLNNSATPRGLRRSISPQRLVLRAGREGDRRTTARRS